MGVPPEAVDLSRDTEMRARCLRFLSRDECRVCQEAPGPLKCAICGVQRYCGRDCQRRDAKRHKAQCPILADTMAALKDMHYSGHLYT